MALHLTEAAAAIAFPRTSICLERVRRTAELATGLDTWGEASVFLEGQARLVEAINGEARLSALGVAVVRQHLLSWSKSYLRFRRTYGTPAHESADFRKPLFIVGFARTGSTLLHRLLAQIRCFQAPRFWQVDGPYDGASPDLRAAARRGRARRKLAFVRVLAPDLLDIHPIRIDGPDECHYLLEPLFVSPQYTLFYHIPSYWAWVRTVDKLALEEVYLAYRRRAWDIHRSSPDLHWLSKTVLHQYFAPALHKVFPDCRVVWLRRSPEHTLASCCSLISRCRRLYSRHVDPHAIGSLVSEMYVQGEYNVSQAVDRLPPDRTMIVDYESLIEDPARTVRHICERFAYSLSHSDEMKVRVELASAQRENAAITHAYDAAHYGLAV
jgi:hypothetical protein